MHLIGVNLCATASDCVVWIGNQKAVNLTLVSAPSDTGGDETIVVNDDTRNPSAEAATFEPLKLVVPEEAADWDSTDSEDGVTIPVQEIVCVVPKGTFANHPFLPFACVLTDRLRIRRWMEVTHFYLSWWTNGCAVCIHIHVQPASDYQRHVRSDGHSRRYEPTAHLSARAYLNLTFAVLQAVS
jgi:hypothetical protein